MTYKEFGQQIQRCLDQHIICGYRAEQKERASWICPKAVEQSELKDILSLKESHGAGIFYDLIGELLGN